MINLEHYRSLFPITERYTYLDHAAAAPLGLHVTRAIQGYLGRLEQIPFDLLRTEHSQTLRSFRSMVARLINAARPDEIVPIPNTAVGINTAANSLPLSAGDNLLILDGDYPANVYPWENLTPRGVLVRRLPQVNGGLDLDMLEAVLDARTRVVALSSALFASGHRIDLAAVGALCKQRGIFFVVDGIQTVGALPIDVQACQIDFLACGAQKWLLGLPGTGFLYCRHGLLDQLQQGAYVGAYSVVDPLNYLDYNFTLQPTAQRFVTGSHNFLGLVGLNASLELLSEAGIPQIARRILDLTDLLIADLHDRGYRIRSTVAAPHRSGIVVIDLPDAEAARVRLAEAGIIVAVRGGGLRVAPHFYNTEQEVLRVGAALGRPISSPREEE